MFETASRLWERARAIARGKPITEVQTVEPPTPAPTKAGITRLKRASEHPVTNSTSKYSPSIQERCEAWDRVHPVPPPEQFPIIVGTFVHGVPGLAAIDRVTGKRLAEVTVDAARKKYGQRFGF